MVYNLDLGYHTLNLKFKSKPVKLWPNCPSEAFFKIFLNMEVIYSMQ